MKKISTYLLLAGLGLTTLACSKDKESTPDKASLLTAKKWRVSAYTTSSTLNGQTTTVDNFALAQPCDKDDFIQFRTDKSVSFDEGATKCDATAAQTTSGTWDFNSDQTKLNLTSPDFGGLAIPFDLLTLDANTLSLRYTGSAQGASTTISTTYTSF